MSVTFPDHGLHRSTVAEQHATSFGEKPLATALAQRAIAEFVTVATSGYVATLSYHQLVQHTWHTPAVYGPMPLGIAAIELLVILSAGHYHQLNHQTRGFFCLSGLGALITAFCLFLSFTFLLTVEQDSSRGALILQLTAMAAAVTGLRAISYSRLHFLLKSGKLSTGRIVLVGDPDHCHSTEETLRSAGIRTVRSFTTPARLATDSAEQVSFIKNLVNNCRNIIIDDVVILNDKTIANFVADLTRALAELPVNVQVIPSDIGAISFKIVSCGPLYALRVYERPLTTFNQRVKRTFDIVLSATGLLLLFPVFIFTALLIRLDTPGPIFFAQRRHGYNNASINVFKFRTMSVLEDGSEFKQATKDDPRITRIGRILRRTSIDELPQLYNVLIGEMSIVGPRPHAIAHNYMFDGLIPLFWRRHTVKPGITGLAH